MFLRLQKHKNTNARVCPPIFQSPLIIPPRYPCPDAPNRHLGYPISPFGVSHFTIWGIPFRHLGYPISPFGVSHFAFWGIPFRHLGYPISPFGMSHFANWGIPFAIWNVPFYHLGYPISPFGISHFAIWSIPFYLLGYIFGTFAHNVQPDFRFAIFVFAAKICMFLSFRFIMFLRNSLGWIKYIL